MDKRLILKNVSVNKSDQGAAATVELSLDDREAVGQVDFGTGPNNQLSPIAEATVKAATEFLPSEFGLTLEKVWRAPDVVYAKVSFRTPDETHPLWGIAPLADDVPGSVAKAILNAINRRSAVVFAE